MREDRPNAGSTTPPSPMRSGATSSTTRLLHPSGGVLNPGCGVPGVAPRSVIDHSVRTPTE